MRIPLYHMLDTVKIDTNSKSLVGLVALALCPFVQYGSQLIVSAEYRNPNFDFTTLFENVVWGNTQIFLPISLVMIGGWLIDREAAHDTLKNIMTIPISMPKLLGVKLLLIGILAVLLGIYSINSVLFPRTLSAVIVPFIFSTS